MREEHWVEDAPLSDRRTPSPTRPSQRAKPPEEMPRGTRRYWIIPIVVVLALALVAFFVGWVQLALSPDTFGVVFTRAHGFEDEVILPEGITWRWDRLVPGALTLYKFNLKPQSTQLKIEATLPSGDVYAAVAPEKPSFTLDVNVSVLYRIRVSSLPALAKTAHVRPEGLGDLYGTLTAEMQSAATDIALSAGTAAGAPGLARWIEQTLPGRFPQLDFVTVTANVVQAPDLALYDKLRDTYLQVAAARETSLTAGAGKLATQEAQAKSAEQRQEQNLTLLEKYGELLNKYPSLIKFLFLAIGTKATPQDLQNLDLLNKLNQLE